MENISYTNSDLLQKLPVDNNEPTKEEVNVIQSLFPPKQNKEMQLIFNEAKESIIVGILFLIFSVPYLDTVIQKILPLAQSPFIMILVKVALMMVLYWVIKHFYLARK